MGPTYDLTPSPPPYSPSGGAQPRHHTRKSVSGPPGQGANHATAEICFGQIGCAAGRADSLGGAGALEANMTSQARCCGYAFSTMTF